MSFKRRTKCLFVCLLGSCHHSCSLVKVLKFGVSERDGKPQTTWQRKSGWGSLSPTLLSFLWSWIQISMKKGAKRTEEVRVADLVLFLWKVCQKTNFPQTFVNVEFIIHKKRKVTTITDGKSSVSDHKRVTFQWRCHLVAQIMMIGVKLKCLSAMFEGLFNTRNQQDLQGTNEV